MRLGLAWRVVMISRATAPIDGSASPRKPRVWIAMQIVAGELRGGVAVDRQFEIGPRHAVAVVGDADQPAAAAVGEHVDAVRARVQRVLDQFLDHARRALDHLAGGDAVDHGFG